MTELNYLTDSYQKEHKSHIISCERKGGTWEIVLTSTIFYPEGGGQPSDKGRIVGPKGSAQVKHVRLTGDVVVHECSLDGELLPNDEVQCEIDWNLRYHNMRVHSAGHIVHEAIKIVAPQLTPVKGEHGKTPYIEYQGTLPIDKKYPIEKEANAIVEKNVELRTEFVSLEELLKRSAWVPAHLPKNKPLRILTVGSFNPIPDGGTQVHAAGEVGAITINSIENTHDHVRVHYEIERIEKNQSDPVSNAALEQILAPEITRMLLEAESTAKEIIASSNLPTDLLRLEVLGAKSAFTQVAKNIKNVPQIHRHEIGKVINFVKANIEQALTQAPGGRSPESSKAWIDVTMPGIRPPEGHLHIVTQAITEITRIFERIGFTRVRHPEVDWDYYAFESLNMPANHPARDEWETFFIEYPGKPGKDAHRQKIVLTPHTSNGQVREMEKGKLPIRMINIAKCYRRQIDVSHTPMFHQFEGLYVDKDVSIGHLKGVMDFFFQQFYGPDRISRIRPFHFQFTEPSFEVDVNCGVCLGKGCKLCKEGWLELGGAGMVHPTVLRNGGVDPDIYSGFAFGWGVERTYMMKSGTKLDDIRLLYSNDVRFLEQF